MMLRESRAHFVLRYSRMTGVRDNFKDPANSNDSVLSAYSLEEKGVN